MMGHFGKLAPQIARCRPGSIDTESVRAASLPALRTRLRGLATGASRFSPRMTPAHPELQREIAALLVEALNLDIAPESIDPQAALYGEGLGLDSIDILEVALVVSQRYGFQLRSDDEDNIRIFTSLASLTEHIATHRTTP